MISSATTVTKILFILWAVFPDGDTYKIRGPESLEKCVWHRAMELEAIRDVLIEHPDLPVPEVFCKGANLE